MKNFKANYISNPFKLHMFNRIVRIYLKARNIYTKFDEEYGSGSGKANESKTYWIIYRLESVKKYTIKHKFLVRQSRFKLRRVYEYKYTYDNIHITAIFKRPQPIGKLIRFDGKLFRIKNTA